MIHADEKDKHQVAADINVASDATKLREFGDSRDHTLDHECPQDTKRADPRMYTNVQHAPLAV